MNLQGDPKKWITDSKESAPADRQVSLAIGGVLGSFILFWGVLGYFAGDKANQAEPIVRQDIETVQLLPRGGSLDDPDPLPVPDIPPLDVPEGSGAEPPISPVALDVPQDATYSDETTNTDQEDGGFWSWVTSIFDGKKEPERQSQSQTRPIASRPEHVVPAPPAAPAQPAAPVQPAPPAQPAPNPPARPRETPQHVVPPEVRPTPGVPGPSTKPEAQLIPPAVIKPAPIVPAPRPTDPNNTNNSQPDVTLITELFERLRIAPPHEDMTFDEDAFGQGWLDIDENNCSTIDDILARDLTVTDSGRGCRIHAGSLHDPYTNEVLDYFIEDGLESPIEVSHVVSLPTAWATGAQDLSQRQREIFKNDPLNLLAVSRAANAEKGDKDVTQWMPTNPDFTCHYLGRQIAVKARYGLTVSPEEHAAMAEGLKACPTDMRVDGDSIINAQ
ncbi:HNH endonuclease family protein [Stomatohabitans albus]|uniref:HNH endonuclease family protein n=1 Tax=Stomatohabitans albus TaxID=3110766 RepID=UPI00300C87BD